jgi:hypothetical protein
MKEPAENSAGFCWKRDDDAGKAAREVALPLSHNVSEASYE